MEYGYESVEYVSGTPFRLFVNNLADIPYHWHNELEILMVLKGSATVITDGQESGLQEDDIMVINANCLHSTLFDHSRPVIVVGLQIEPQYYDRFFKDFSKRYFLFKSFLHSKTFDRKANPVRSAISHMFLMSSSRQSSIISCWSIANLLCAYLYYNIPWETRQTCVSEAGSDDRRRVNEIMTFIKENAAEKITLQELSEKLHINKYYFSHFFKEKVGLGVKKYIINVRLDNAANLLFSTSDNIAQIAFSCGFTNITSFYKQFQERYGCLPTQFRDMYLEKGALQRKHSKMDQLITEKLIGYTKRDYAGLDEMLYQSRHDHSFLSMMHKNP